MVNQVLETSHPSLGAAFKFFVLTLLRTLLHSFALFCAQRKLNPLIFKRFRTLSQKHGGTGGCFRSVNSVYPDFVGVLSEISVFNPSFNSQLKIPSGSGLSTFNLHLLAPLNS